LKAAPPLLALLLVACSSQSPTEKLAKTADPVGSWLATLQMTAEAWSENRVPTHFAQDTATAADKKLAKIAKEAAKSPAAPAVREPLRRLVDDAETATHALEALLDRGDRHAARAAAARLQALGDRFDAWKQSVEGPSS
jgi:hypothetical protein